MNCTNCQGGQLASNDRVNFICNNCRAHYQYNPNTSTLDFVAVIPVPPHTVGDPNPSQVNQDSFRTRVATLQNANPNQSPGHNPDNWPNQNNLPSFVKTPKKLKLLFFIIPAIIILTLGGLFFYNYNHLKQNNASAAAKNFFDNVKKSKSKIISSINIIGDNPNNNFKIFPVTLNFNGLDDNGGKAIISTALGVAENKLDLNYLFTNDYNELYAKLNSLKLDSKIATQYPELDANLGKIDNSWYQLSTNLKKASSSSAVNECSEDSEGLISQLMSKFTKEDLSGMKYSIKAPKYFISDKQYDLELSGNLKDFSNAVKNINAKLPTDCQISKNDLEDSIDQIDVDLEKINIDLKLKMTETNFKFDLNLNGLESIYDNQSSKSNGSSNYLSDEYGKLRSINIAGEIIIDNNIKIDEDPGEYKTLDELYNSFNQDSEDISTPIGNDSLDNLSTSASNGAKIFSSFYRL